MLDYLRAFLINIINVTHFLKSFKTPPQEKVIKCNPAENLLNRNNSYHIKPKIMTSQLIINNKYLQHSFITWQEALQEQHFHHSTEELKCKTNTENARVKKARR